MSEFPDPGARAEAAAEAAATAEAVQTVAHSKWFRWRRDGTALVKYLLDSEVHTFAFSVAANAILSFIPFIVLMYTLAHSVFHSELMVGVVNDMVRYFLPSNWDFVARNLFIVAAGTRAQVLSLVMILVACTGIFLPLEVALNQAWGVVKSRNYLHNQAIALGLALLMVALGLTCMLLSAWEQQLLSLVFFRHTQNVVFNGIKWAWLAATMAGASIVFFFSIYWLLPNRKVAPRQVMRVSIYTGIIWLASKIVFSAVLPYLDLWDLYGPFYISVGLLFWAYVSGLILFAGAQFSVARLGERAD